MPHGNPPRGETIQGIPDLGPSNPLRPSVRPLSDTIYTLAVETTEMSIGDNVHKVDSVSIPNAIRQMVHALNCIRENAGLKFVKIPNGIVRQSLDPTQFGDKEHLSSDKWTQAYMNWLTLVDTIYTPEISVGWHEHYHSMLADKEFSFWFPAWRKHNKQLCSKFMCKPFLVDPKCPSYVQAIERVCMQVFIHSNPSYATGPSNWSQCPME
ncbi:hypothetical protein JB92DRAFT_2828071 [Gautieria morchelliformis]|nr:hypothetical protein JB92DRAFT_2828071 [Gautieria morchelliformis]